MVKVVVRCPDGVTRAASGIFGRGVFGLGQDPIISRRHFSLALLEGDDAVVLTCCGLNGLTVEVLRQGVDGDEQWQPINHLIKGGCTVLEVGQRFHVSGRPESTTFTVELPEPRTPDAQEPPRMRTAAADADSSCGEQRDAEQLPAGFHLLRTDGIPARANRGMLGVQFSDLVHGEMQWVLVSAYMIELHALLDALPDLRAAFRIVIAHGWRTDRDDSHNTGARTLNSQVDGTLRHKITIHQPRLYDEYGCHHTKAFVIEYATGLRVIIHTAAHKGSNNIETRTQGLWWQDFPRKTEGSPPTSAFERELSGYLACLKLPGGHGRHAAQLCRAHDFSAARAHLIVSRPGRWSGAKLHVYGHLAVRRVLSQERFPDGFAGAPIVAQSSSLVSFNEEWLREFRFSLAAGLTTSGDRLGDGPSGPAGLQLVWPTAEEIRRSSVGWAAGGAVNGPPGNVERRFLRPYWHRWGGDPAGRQAAMPHIKSYVRYRSGDELAWFMLASHNVSGGAWGKLRKNGSELHIMHYELAVLCVPSLEAAWRASPLRDFSCTPGFGRQQSAPAWMPSSAQDPVSFKAFRPTWYGAGSPQQQVGIQKTTADALWFPVPYMLPPVRYKQADVPWSSGKHHPGMDAFGMTLSVDGCRSTVPSFDRMPTLPACASPDKATVHVEV